MGYIGYVYVESKAFEFRSDVRGGVRFEERSKGLTRSVIMAWPPIHWLLVAWDFLAPVEKAKEKWRTFRFGSIVYVLLRRTNRYGNFLEISEYGEKGRRSFIIIPEGEDGKGWTDWREQLSKLKFFHEKQKLGGTSSGKHTGIPAAGLVGCNKGKLIVSSDQTSLLGEKKSYAEVVQGSSNFQTVAGKNKVGEAVLEKVKGRNSLVHALSTGLEVKEKAGSTTGEQMHVLLAEKKEKEKTDIMTGKEQVGVESVSEMLSEFKKDLFKCLEGYLAGWTPPSVAVNRAKKGAVFGGPKLRKEKPKPHVKLTYFRKKFSRPNMCWQEIKRPEITKKHGHESGLSQVIKPPGALKILEKGESSGTRSCPVSPLKLVSPAISVRENIVGVDSGNCRLSPVMEELQSRCGPGYQAALFVDDNGSPAKEFMCAGGRPSPPAVTATSQDFQRSSDPRQSPMVNEISDAGERPNTPEDATKVRVCLSSSVPRHLLLASESVDAGEWPSRLEDSATVRDSQKSPVSLQIPSASDSVVDGEWPSPPADIIRSSIGGEIIQGHFLLEDERLSPQLRLPDSAGERPSLPVTFQHYQRLPVSDSGLSSVPVGPPGLVEFQGKLSLDVNSANMDEALCSVLMGSHDGEEEGQVMVQPLNVLYPNAENEFVFPDWVIRCAERIHSRVGITYIGHKWQFMALLTFIEKERMKELEAQSPPVRKRNREIKNLESSINYDNRGEGQSSRGKRKGRGSKVVL
jgi:hypothetical protein